MSGKETLRSLFIMTFPSLKAASSVSHRLIDHTVLLVTPFIDFHCEATWAAHKSSICRRVLDSVQPWALTCFKSVCDVFLFFILQIYGEMLALANSEWGKACNFEKHLIYSVQSILLELLQWHCTENVKVWRCAPIPMFMTRKTEGNQLPPKVIWMKKFEIVWRILQLAGNSGQT